jgi:DNA recombination protein RmuC
MEILYIISGIIIGCFLVYFFLRWKNLKESKGFQSRLHDLDKEKSILMEKFNMMARENGELLNNLTQEREKSGNLNNQLVVKQVEYKNIEERLENHKKELDNLQKKFTTEFENIASKILKQNTEEFSLRNQKNIGEILNPLKEKIETFEKKVHETYEKGLKDQTDLKAELKNLHELNKKISEEASNLTNALKADTKKQGNWGELILEKVLERSGLIKDQEYITQYTNRNEDGEMIRPDIVINLPDNKHIIIDSKVSLLSYELYVNTENAEEKEKHIKAHVDSIKEHIKGLSKKNYQHGNTLDSPDFVLLFMPIESAFSAAIQYDTGLFNYAWDRKIVIVSPTTLLATLKTVESIWKHEKQTQNAIEIARQSGNLYDKFVLFLKDLEKIGIQLDQTQRTYRDAHKKLGSGSGNIIGRIEKLKELGAKASKDIPVRLLQNPDEKNLNE